MPDGFFEDTDPETFKVWIDLLRKRTPGERAARVFELTEFVESLQRFSVRTMYPQADEREVFLRAASRRLDRETMIKVYGWDPELHR